jgi:hypothetical protein
LRYQRGWTGGKFFCLHSDKGWKNTGLSQTTPNDILDINNGILFSTAWFNSSDSTKRRSQSAAGGPIKKWRNRPCFRKEQYKEDLFGG